MFGYENTEVLEGVHLEFLRKVVKLRKSTSRYMINVEFCRHQLNIVIKQRMINFWTRLLNGKISKFSYQIYLYMLNSNERGFK